MKTCYIAGPMRGITHYNFPAFDAAKRKVEGLGYVPVSPADMDREVGFDPFKLPDGYDWSIIPEGFSFDDCVTRDIRAIRDAEAIYMLRGWQQSKGAIAEKALAEWLRKEVLHESGETIETDASTGAQKGVKLARFDLIPTNPLWELAEHYGRGAQKYAERNFEMGYKWSRSYAACLRHLNQFWSGEDFDPETGSKHVIAAAWHCFAMALWMTTHPEKDDRVKPAVKTPQK